MSGRPWTLDEERLIIAGIGKKTVREMAEELGRSYTSVRSHIQWMGYVGRLDGSARVVSDSEWEPNLKTCPSCLTPRSKFSRKGVCSVCSKEASLEGHERKMHEAYENLPKELKDRTNGTFRVERNFKLMGKSRGLSRPSKPDTSGMSRFDEGKAMDEYYRALESYELAKLTLDIDAVKQRRSKWLRKAREWRAAKGIAPQ